jgi:hypothetical protein
MPTTLHKSITWYRIAPSHLGAEGQVVDAEHRQIYTCEYSTYKELGNCAHFKDMWHAHGGWYSGGQTYIFNASQTLRASKD